MTTITKEIPVENKLLYQAGGVAVSAFSIGAQVYAPAVSIPIDILRELGQRLIFEPVISNETVTHQHIFQSILAGTVKATASKVIGKYAFLASGALECADKFIMGKEVSFQTFCAGTAAGLASKGTSLAFRHICIHTDQLDFLAIPGSKYNEVLYVGTEGVLAGSCAQMARNMANGNDIESGVWQAGVMGGFTSASNYVSAKNCDGDDYVEPALQRDYSLPKDVVKRQELRATQSALRVTREQVTTLRAENSRLVSEVRSANTALKDLRDALKQYKEQLDAASTDAKEAKDSAARSNEVLFTGKNGGINHKALREGQKAQKAKASNESEYPSAADAAKSPLASDDQAS